MSFRGFAYLLLLFLLILNIPFIRAQSSDDGNTTEEGETTIVPSRISIHPNDNMLLQGLIASGSTWIPFPYNWSIVEQDIEVILTYTASEELRESKATLTVLVGGDVPVKTVSLVGDGQSHTVTFSFPSNLMNDTSGLYLQYHAYLPTTGEECEQSFLPSQWVIIGGDTQINMLPDENPKPPELSSLYPSLISDSPFLPAHETIIVLPDAPLPDYLAAANGFAQWFGTRFSSYPRPFVVRYESILTEEERNGKNLVVIGEPQTSALIREIIPHIQYDAFVDNQFQTLSGEVIPAEDAIFHILQSPWNVKNNILLLTGNSSVGVRNTGYALTKPNLVSALHGQSNFILSDVINQPTADAETQDPSAVDDIITFEEFGNGSIIAQGIGTSVQTVFITRQPGWILQEGAEIVLNLGTSSLDHGSYVSVFLDDLFLGTIDTSEQTQMQVSVPIPVEDINKIWEANPSTFARLRLEVTNVFQEIPCQASVREAVWTRINNTSFMKFPHDYVQLPDITAYPYPFTEDSLTTTFVLPENPTQDDVEIMLQMAAGIGAFARPNVKLNVITTASFAETELRNAIIIGGFDRQPLITSVLQDITDLPLPNVYTSLANTNTAVIREVIAPWDANSTVLLLYGNNAESLKAGAGLLNTYGVPEGAFIREEPGLRVIELPLTSTDGN